MKRTFTVIAVLAATMCTASAAVIDGRCSIVVGDNIGDKVGDVGGGLCYH